MTKTEIRSLVKNLLPKRDKTGKFHPQVIDAAIETVMNQVFYDVFMKQPRDLDNYTTTYGDDGSPVAVAPNAVSGIEQSTIPATYVPLPDKASGVRAIYPLAFAANAFYPMSKREIDLAGSNSYFSQATDKIGYAVRGEIVEYYLMNSTIKAAGVRMDVLQTFRAYDDDDEVKFPLGREADLIKGVLEMLGVQPPTDLSDLNNETVQANG